jgi:hypothetical protein
VVCYGITFMKKLLNTRPAILELKHVHRRTDALRLYVFILCTWCEVRIVGKLYVEVRYRFRSATHVPVVYIVYVLYRSVVSS